LTCPLPYYTNENTTLPWTSAVSDLTTGPYSYPTNALIWSNGLADACSDHVRDIGPCGGSGHYGTDGGSSPSDRISRYVTWNALGENLAWA